jgi:dihydropyrimidinase
MADAGKDLVVRGGTVVTAGGRGRADVVVRDGRIAAVVGPDGPTSDRTGRDLDATGCFVLPGGIDMHVHLATVPMGPGDGFVDDVLTGSRAAIAGGITTFGPMAFPESDGETMLAATRRDLDVCAREAAVDYLVHPAFVVPDDHTRSDIEALAAAGHRSVKTATLFLDQRGADLVAAVALAGRLGMLTMIHCEDGALIDYATAALVAGEQGGLEHYPLSRPDVTESVAVERAIAICEITGAPIYLVHLSSARALAAARAARARGLRVFTETRPIYLNLTEQVHALPDAGKFVGMPPVRTAADRDALWQGIADGAVHTVASDHAPWRLAEKIDPALDVASARKGVAELETMLPMLYADGVATGRISLERFVAVTATNPARLFGLYPRKGTIAVGADADLLVLDPSLRRTVDGASGQSNAGYSVYDGRLVAGWPRFVVGRGQVLLDGDGIHADPGRGRLQAQGGLQAP